MPLVSCACTAAVACFSRDAVESDLCNMTSDMLLFFRMGFLSKLMKELLFDIETLDVSVF
jgi:hypothetical protein